MAKSNKELPNILLENVLKEIGAIAGSMITIFTVLSLVLPPSLVQPIGALLIGLILTYFFISTKKLSVVTALITFMAGSVLLIVIHLMLIRPTTVVGTVIDINNASRPGLMLVLTDSSGIDHKSVTDKNGAFEIKNVPEGKFTVMVNNELLFGGQVPSGWARIINPTVDLGSPVYNMPTPNTIPAANTPLPPTSTIAALPTETPIPASTCPYQEKTDNETIVKLIQAEADASNTKSIAIMQAIFDPNAIFYDYAPYPRKSWVGPTARYQDDLFKTTDFEKVEHFDILPVGQGIAGNMAWYTSGSKGFYSINGGDRQAFSNGSLISTTPPPTQYGSEHWILKKNSAGCWVIVQLEFNAGHILFPQ